ncbi:helix-turn-helix domain-containing protein [Niastella populi]|uniref:Transcriptional regulator n=1 Tax=Niastella populi TaxID=550983 RepID=A0A1V9GD08_9BACT|nr:AraC family transcriptional regulator [Niastella populi]OQP68306.1 transcriptional regulator [Niastella populi]
MKKDEIKTLSAFYKSISANIPEGIDKAVGHFNVFKIDEYLAGIRAQKGVMPYNRRNYYKISLINGRNHVEYADKVINIEKSALLFGTPRIPYHYVPQDEKQMGYFCIFTDSYFSSAKNGVVLDELPIYKPGGFPVFQLTDDDYEEIAAIFRKMAKELASDYVYKYDLLRNYLMELIHYGQKLQPASTLPTQHKAVDRVTSIFIELLERQFPIESLFQRLELRTASDYANRLSVHVNYLNKALKESTGKTTTEIIGQRVLQEARILLRHTNWNISQVAWGLGFEEVAHFSNFFRKHTGLSPNAFREEPDKV